MHVSSHDIQARAEHSASLAPPQPQLMFVMLRCKDTQALAVFE